MLAQEIIRIKRDGAALAPDQIEQFVRGLTDGSWSEGQVAALAMAIFLRGMSRAETVALTRTMRDSGEVLHWDAAVLGGPVLDKHSTGGVGDKVSLMLGPIVAACGGFVPMISGRGLGHTGGTLDKFDSIPGYNSAPDNELLRATLRQAGCAIVGQTAQLAPADKRLYAIRDVTGTVESIPLITASILSKKLAAGLHGLVMDVKSGNGAFAATPEIARELAGSLVQVANGAGLPTHAWITDMNQVLGHNCGNVLEVQEALDFLGGRQQEPRLLEVTRMLCAEMLLLGGLAATREAALAKVDQALSGGKALERFAMMVHALGGPADFVERASHHLQPAPVRLEVKAEREGWIGAMSTRDIGLLVVTLGGGRHKASDRIDHRVGLSGLLAIGQPVARDQAIATVHAADQAAAEAAAKRLRQLIQIDETPGTAAPVLVELLKD
jgi:thymidine phosphorylase